MEWVLKVVLRFKKDFYRMLQHWCTVGWINYTLISLSSYMVNKRVSLQRSISPVIDAKDTLILSQLASLLLSPSMSWNIMVHFHGCVDNFRSRKADTFSCERFTYFSQKALWALICSITLSLAVYRGVPLIVGMILKVSIVFEVQNTLVNSFSCIRFTSPGYRRLEYIRTMYRHSFFLFRSN